MPANFQELVRLELRSAQDANAPLNSLHEGYGVLLEEVDELWDEIKKKPYERSSRRLLEELVQVGAMAQRIAEDMRLL